MILYFRGWSDICHCNSLNKECRVLPFMLRKYSPLPWSQTCARLFWDLYVYMHGLVGLQLWIDCAPLLDCHWLKHVIPQYDFNLWQKSHFTSAVTANYRWSYVFAHFVWNITTSKNMCCLLSSPSFVCYFWQQHITVSFYFRGKSLSLRRTQNPIPIQWWNVYMQE